MAGPTGFIQIMLYGWLIKPKISDGAYNADPGLCRSAALLHDVSDARIAREDPTSEVLSLQIAEELLNQADFDQQTIRLLVDDALRYHSCRDGEKPKSDVGKVLATADAMAHFQTDFYPYAFSAKLFSDYQKTKNWAAGKIDKDYKNKIFFEDIKAEVLPQYETLKMVFGEL